LYLNRREVCGTNTQQKKDNTPEKKIPASKEKRPKRPHLKSEEDNPPRRPYPQNKSQAEVAAENQTRRGEQVNVIMRER
jgi:hypothetical protein